MDFIQKVLEFFNSNAVASIVGAVYLLVEYFLGKTDLVKAGSTLELFLNGIKKVLEFFKLKKPSL